MSAAEIIEQIKALPPQDRRVVLDFARHADTTEPPAVHYAESEEFTAAADRVFAQHDELLKRLAE